MLLINLPDGLLATVKDVGDWFHIDAKYREEFIVVNINYYFWNIIFSEFLNESLNFTICDIFQNDSFINIDHIDYLQKKIDNLNSLQNDCCFSLFDGIEVNNHVYTVTELNNCIEGWDSHYKNIFEDIGDLILSTKEKALFFNVTSLFQMAFLLGLTAVIRKKTANVELFLANYSYENFIIDTNKVCHIFDGFCNSLNHKEIVNRIESKNKLKHTQLNTLTLNEFNIISIKLFDMNCYWNKCTFCSHNKKKCSNSGYNIDNAVEKIIYYKNMFDINSFVLIDESIPKGVLLDFSKKIIKLSLSISWNCRIRFDNNFTINELIIIKRAGCKEFLFGIETNSNYILKKINKYDCDFDEEHFFNICKLISSAEIKLHFSFIVGFPFERKQDLYRLKIFLFKLAHGGLQFTYFINCFVLFPKTAIIKQIKNIVQLPQEIENDFNLPIPIDCYNPNLLSWIKLMDYSLQRKLYCIKFLKCNEILIKYFTKSAYALFFSHKFKDVIFKSKFRGNI